MVPPRCSRVRLCTLLAVAFLLATAPACAISPERTQPERTRARTVMSSAYTSHASQTNGSPFLAAWGDQLTPDMKVVAVSRDLLAEGMVRGSRVRIEGLPGEYVVLDKMAKRWRNKIDVYMGNDLAAARQWGVREVRIEWSPPAP